MSFLFNYHRLLSASKLRRYCIGAMVLIVLWAGGVCILVLVMCVPLAGVWDPKVDAKCVPHITVMWWFNGVFNSIGDLFILTLPIPVLWRLQLPRRQKAYLLFVFSLGFLTVGISIARMRWLEMDADMTWWNVSPALWSLGELTSAISCSCLPFFKPLTLRVKSSISRATAGHDHPRIPGGEGDEESNAHSSVGAGQKEFVQNSNLMRAVLFTLSFYLHNTYGLEEGVNIESKAGNGQTPLSYAAESGHEAVVKLLQSYKG
ncbi:hypothetical protein IWW34DRAFT_811090 [Fusarium oxysporum f. sp. albedinis]|nr:hypothetical protein IWW34DRAFT_811690 [Fusarium oxysporum f. sp. albedinis]KAI3572405.1 hypothetical protein IWW34DRAFT_811090 [Fusarium oxysporum f. sp. albedinis]